MTATKRWTVDVYIDEHEDTTRAEARLRTRDDTQLTGVGTAHRNPSDVDVPEIGDELAVARALGELSRKLLRTAAEDIEDVTHQPVHLDR
ncbi:MAG TPA: DUF1876 domain-containing protein [Jiangellaceae bacterium]|nr:DUF1876 domain-containing protein [Jiangellaceae bacterium]